MSIIHFSGNANRDAAVINLNLAGESILHAVANGNTAEAGVQVDSNGNMYKDEGGVFTQIDSGTGDWADPTPVAANYEVYASASPFDTVPDVGPALDTWHTIDGDKLWYNTHSTNDSESKSTLTIKIRKIGAPSTEVSATYIITARVGTPI